MRRSRASAARRAARWPTNPVKNRTESWALPKRSLTNDAVRLVWHPLVGSTGHPAAVVMTGRHGGSGICSLGEAPAVGGPMTGNVVVPRRWQTTSQAQFDSYLAAGRVLVAVRGADVLGHL
jgi:hypothetical protein